MSEQDERSQAARALATVHEHQQRTRKASRVPWWFYLVMFLLTVLVSGANDIVGLSGSKVIAGVLVLALVVVIVASLIGRAPLLSRARGVGRQQSFDPRAFGAVIIVAGAALWLTVQYGSGVAHDVAAAVGLSNYPYTVTGVIYGVVLTGIFAASNAVLGASQRRADR